MEGTAAGWSTLLLDGTSDLRNQSLFTDVTLVAVDGSTVNVHSLILAAGSGHFKEALQKVRSTGNMGNIMIKLAYSNPTVQHIVNFLYSGKISVPQSEMKEVKVAAKALTIPVLEALCDTYTKNLEQFMQANEIPQDSEVSVQITHHVGNETEEQANQDKLAESGIPVELADPQPASSDFREGEEQVTLEYDPETQTVQIQRAETLNIDNGDKNEELEENMETNQADTSVDLIVAATNSLSNTAKGSTIYSAEETYQTDTCGVITNVVSLEEVSKTVSIESLLANQAAVSVQDMLTKNLEEQLRSSVRASPANTTQVYRYRCNICNKDFSSLYRLKGHHATHFGEKAHQCGVCGKKYIQLEYLREHESVHRDERPFKCGICGKDFRILRHLKKHQITHSDKRPYVCLVCNKTFQRSDRLKAHTRTHSGDRPFECELCGKSFALRETLVKHRDTHNEKRPFKCTICLSEFKRKDGLMTHLETHRADSRFVCGVAGCGRGFNQLIHLGKHISSTHSILDVDSVVIEKPKISTDELNELLAEMAQKQSPDKMDKCVTEQHASYDNSEENFVPGDGNGTGADNTRTTRGHTAGRARSGSRQQDANSPAHITAESNSNDIGLVITTRSQKAADGQVEELTSVETIPLSSITVETKVETTD